MLDAQFIGPHAENVIVAHLERREARRQVYAPQSLATGIESDAIRKLLAFGPTVILGRPNIPVGIYEQRASVGGTCETGPRRALYADIDTSSPPP